jgi:hypothetical protein
MSALASYRQLRAEQERRFIGLILHSFPVEALSSSWSENHERAVCDVVIKPVFLHLDDMDFLSVNIHITKALESVES